ncbi:MULTISPECIES: Ppx/GppA phosphatase family protein [unclassified Campylobacter]|uniref:Ppx/GppA phosphatase family protein n=1 Tax=unclassified Campylobacter TaxID=2593542 RepID=UPI0012383A18|nr:MULTISPECIES: Ppx/GppA phosphatase family protein [unclassified Campylobacter]KAA6227130.1 Ppx/GppA family phosphatase [Campylobacter sp. LR185c]KAA6227473.1 Ppx/GppA family phosphatase [Campylobacter sp. LR196d]KAA6228499.1 Ppx/GppA family phosphatase [Campylobacter sp. LR286c]KAA6230890.1 Ppx/GppA family phosphatase [Campylobacter sp. LR291e]KAA6233524.1 Ppx/GppA family phosphatase [Campylobacter sp. LR264d]
MAKKTAVVDLGSNSIRMVVFEKTSRYGFFTTYEYKRKVRLGENAYNNGKVLQEEPMQRAEDTLAFFKQRAIKHQCKKIFIVGTSALRDAPNSKYFVKRIKDKLGLNIKVIDGKNESFLGGFAALNLLSSFKNATTLDIGGGSSELCLIQNGKIVDFISLDVGTVRLKELFYDTKKQDSLDDFLKPILEQIPANFANDNLIAIGGSLRAISNSIMQKNSYPLKNLHDFRYDFKAEYNHVNKILNADFDDLINYGIKKERFDTIKEGTLIFLKIADKLKIKQVITSGVGIREGVYLQDLLRPANKFPANFNTSLKCLQDRFLHGDKKTPHFALQIFNALNPLHKLQTHFRTSLINAAKLCHIGEYLDFYFANEHSFYFILNSLNYGFSHQEKALIASIIRFNGKKLNPYYINNFKELLPKLPVLMWLNFILALAKILSLNEEKINFAFSNNTLYIYNDEKMLNLPLDEIKKIAKPEVIILAINQKPNI